MPPIWNSTCRVVLAAATLVAACGLAPRADAVTGATLALRSSGVGQNSSWILNDNGYVGTYVTLAAPGDVTVSIQAAGQEFGGVAPRMNIVVADSVAPFDVAPGVAAYEHTFALPAGTHFIRTEFNNDPQKTARALTVSSLDVMSDAATAAAIANTNSSTNALATADNYTANFRRGPARLELVGVDPGADVHVKLARHDFRFGTAVGGTNLTGVNSYLNNANYSNFLLQNFNAITQGNAGKWAYNEANRDSVTMAAVDRFFEYAEQHNLDVRLHNMLWGDSQQPGWATTLLNNANSGNATAKADLRTEISERIDHYVGDGDADPNDGDRARRYVEMDLLNEHVHQPKYWNVYGAAGVADIFNEAAAAVTAAGSTATLYLNEYNVLQFGADNYGNWYREDVEEITSAGGAVSGVGVQYYALNAGGSNAHSAARIQQIFQNLSVTGLPITLSEFGVQTAGGTTVAQAGTYLNETMRMVFGTPGATTFNIWGFWANDIWNQAPLAALMDANWNLTSVGQIYQDLMSQWNTDLMLQIGEDGAIDFTGFYGDYEVTVGGETYLVSLGKGVTDYQLVVDLAADFNYDGTVDGDDLAIWQSQAFGGGTAGADANNDGQTDGADFLVWQQQLGISETAPLTIAAADAVPEPASSTLLVLGILSACRFRRNRPT